MKDFYNNNKNLGAIPTSKKEVYKLTSDKLTILMRKVISKISKLYPKSELKKQLDERDEIKSDLSIQVNHVLKEFIEDVINNKSYNELHPDFKIITKGMTKNNEFEGNSIEKLANIVAIYGLLNLDLGDTLKNKDKKIIKLLDEHKSLYIDLKNCLKQCLKLICLESDITTKYRELKSNFSFLDYYNLQKESVIKDIPKGEVVKKLIKLYKKHSGDNSLTLKM